MLLATVVVASEAHAFKFRRPAAVPAAPVAPLAPAIRPNPETIAEAQNLANTGKVDEAVTLLTTLAKDDSVKERRALTHLSLAMIDYRAARDTEAEQNFKLAIDEGTRVSDYAHYYLGLLKRKRGKDQEAQVDFTRVIELKSPKSLENEARFQIAEILLNTKQWKVAAVNLESLKKAYRGKDRYSDVLFNLARADLHAGKRAPACKVARELFAKYPSLPALKSWGASLPANQIDGIKLNCLADAKDLKTRVRRLWLGGEAERATNELKSFRGPGATMSDEDDTVEPADYGIDAMLANHLLGEGQVSEAMKLILRHYESQKNRPNYQALLAKASARAGEYQAAIASYQKAYELAPASKNAAANLFQSAFTSYQIQDYDGATRRFDKFVKAFPRSGMTPDARWHLAWMRYLRADYTGAFQSFAQLGREPVRYRRARGGRRVLVTGGGASVDRIQYWSAMSLLRQGKADAAIPLFEKLARDPAVGFYTLIAYYRLLSIPNAKVPAGLELRLGLAKKVDLAKLGALPTESELREAAIDAAQLAKADAVADNPAPEVASGDEPPESGNESSGASETAENDSGSDADAASFKGVGLATKFERARDLALVGLEDGARRELAEIERRGLTEADRHLLMVEYAQVRNFERSSYIGELGFGTARLREGLRGESRQYWEYAYPRAWEGEVVAASKITKVPEELIWGIMRAESHYRQDAQSPVGALGLMQIMPFTGRKVASLLNIDAFETRSLLEPETNIRLGARYLQRLLEKFSGNVALTAASYNAGPHRVNAWVKNFGNLDMDEFIEHIPYVETRNYVKRVTRNYQLYGFLYRGAAKTKADAPSWLVRPVGVELKDSVTSAEIW